MLKVGRDSLSTKLLVDLFRTGISWGINFSVQSIEPYFANFQLEVTVNNWRKQITTKQKIET